MPFHIHRHPLPLLPPTHLPLPPPLPPRSPRPPCLPAPPPPPPPPQVIRSESSLWSPTRGQLNSPPGCRTWLRPSTTSSSREALRITHTVSNEQQMGPHGSTPSDRLATSAASRNHTRLQLILQLGCDVQTAQTHACGHVSYPRAQHCRAQRPQPAHSPQAQVLSCPCGDTGSTACPPRGRSRSPNRELGRGAKDRFLFKTPDFENN